MKGYMRARVVELLFHVLQRAYCNALMNTPGLMLLYLGFNGNGAYGMVEIKDNTQSAFQVIEPNSEVEMFQECRHSSYFRENPSQMLVYVKPIENAHNWCNGIAVLIEHLAPVRITPEVFTENSSKEKSRKGIETIDKYYLSPKFPTDEPKSP